MRDFSKIIKSAREKMGTDPRTLADQLGVRVEAYFDLENDNNDFILSADIPTIEKLCEILRIDYEGLFGGGSGEEGTLKFTPEDVARITEHHMLVEKMTPEELEEAVGWEFARSMVDVSFMRNNPIAFFMDLGKEIKVSWRTLLYAYLL